MTDAHCHAIIGGNRVFLCEPHEEGAEGDVMFYGCHPWCWRECRPTEALRGLLEENPCAGVGEIGLDRLKEREIPRGMRDVFAAHLAVAAEFGRPVVLHGAKCWGEVVKACMPYKGRIPAFLFHGFSRSGGLLPDIAAMNGFVSVGPSVLNNHAVNYRALVRSLPEEIILIESDATAENAGDVPSLEAIAAKVAEIRQVGYDELCASAERNAGRFVASLTGA